MSDPYAEQEQWLYDMGLCRCRQNFIRAIYKAWELDELPTTWDEEAEMQLPPDLRMSPAPSDPLFGQPIWDEEQVVDFEDAERYLLEKGLERTRENWILALYAGCRPTDDWDGEREAYLPFELQLPEEEIPDTPFGNDPAGPYYRRFTLGLAVSDNHPRLHEAGVESGLGPTPACKKDTIPDCAGDLTFGMAEAANDR
jgi:hypothetical protein